jgi:hypothetical protein
MESRTVPSPAAPERGDLSPQERGEVKRSRGWRDIFTFASCAYCGWVIMGESRSESLSASSAPLLVSTVV